MPVQRRIGEWFSGWLFVGKQFTMPTATDSANSQYSSGNPDWSSRDLVTSCTRRMTLSKSGVWFLAPDAAMSCLMRAAIISATARLDVRSESRSLTKVLMSRSRLPS